MEPHGYTVGSIRLPAIASGYAAVVRLCALAASRRSRNLFAHSSAGKPVDFCNGG
jgi:hypothetical protein